MLTQRGILAIEDIQIGDMVWSADPDRGEQQWNEVIHLSQGEGVSRLFDLTVVDAQNHKFVISVTPDRPFLVPKLDNYIVIQELAEGTLLQTDDETFAKVESIQVHHGDFTVHNLEINWAHNCFVSSFTGGPRVQAHNPNDENDSCWPSFVVGNRSVAEVVGNTQIKPGIQGLVDKPYVERYACDIQMATPIGIKWKSQWNLLNFLMES